MQICFLQFETNSFKLRKINWFIAKKYKMLIETEFFLENSVSIARTSNISQ